MNTEPGKLFGTKLSFQMNHGSICLIKMAMFMLDAMLVNVDFQSVISNDIVAKHVELLSGVPFHITDNRIFYELRVI